MINTEDSLMASHCNEEIEIYLINFSASSYTIREVNLYRSNIRVVMQVWRSVKRSSLKIYRGNTYGFKSHYLYHVHGRYPL